MKVIPSAIPMQFDLVCGTCGHKQAPALTTPVCENCGNDWWEVLYDYDRIKNLWPDILLQRPMKMWRYRELLPLHNENFQISMGEGGTTLLKGDNLGMMLGVPNLFIKDERQNPTNSFKDRQAALVISMMKEAGVKELVVASTGNVAISYSAYSAHAGIKLWSFVPSLVPSEKMREIAIYGSEVIKVTDTYDATKKVANEFAAHKGIHADQGIRNIGTRESMKTIAFEIAEQLAQELGPPSPGIPWRVPDWYIQAVSGGMGPIGVWKGFLELMQMGLVDRLPKLAIIQIEGCAPMVNSYAKNLPVVEPVTNPNTRVITIATGNPGPAYTYLYRVIQEYGGTFTSVSDEETFRALHILAKMEGMSIEPAAATAFAGVFKLLNEGIIKKNETIVVNCSGHTFPVEKFLLDEDWLKVISTSMVQSESSILTKATASHEGLLGALDHLDERVKRIAIIEDNPDAARLLRRILQTQREFQIVEANSGREGLHLIKTTHPDLVLLDLMMPDMDGFAVLEELEADKMLDNLPVIVITAKELSTQDLNRLHGQIQMLLQKGTFMDENLIVDINALLGQKTQG